MQTERPRIPIEKRIEEIQRPEDLAYRVCQQLVAAAYCVCNLTASILAGSLLCSTLYVSFLILYALLRVTMFDHMAAVALIAPFNAAVTVCTFMAVIRDE
jgi:hypothetical protein